MNRLFFVLIICFGFGSSFGQIRFEPGYILDSNGKKVECLIKNQDWKNNPDKILYKLSDSDSTRTAVPSSISGFKVQKFPAYISADVKIDRSTTVLSALTSDKNPKWSQEKLFLKISVKGKASLYEYTDRNLNRFFYSVDASPIQQLVFKEYVHSQGQIGQNNTYRSQLWSEVRCANADVGDLNSIKYSENDLSRYFKKYNACNGVAEVENEPSAKRNVFNLKVFGGINSSSVEIRSSNGLSVSKFEFDHVVSPRIGIEGEFILPFHKNKWGVALESAYQSYESRISKGTSKSSVNYSFVEFGVGFRHYFFLSEKALIFLNIHYHLYPRVYVDRELMVDNSVRRLRQPDLFAAGIGFQYARFSAELHYFGKTDIMSDYLAFRSEYSRTAFTVGYRLIQFSR